MNKLIFFVLAILSTGASAQKITRGPEPGEIYFMASATTVFNDVIYHTTDFGETAVIKDSIIAMTEVIGAIAADKTEGGVYIATMLEQLFYSPAYGNVGSWDLKHNGIYSSLNSGVNQGFIYEGSASHSQDFGVNFENHIGNGAFGSYFESEIDTNQVGYLVTQIYNVIDTLYLFKSIDNFNNLELINKLNFLWYSFLDLSRGNKCGELFLFNDTPNRIYFSSDSGYTWELKNTFTCPNLPIKGITGGRLDGELYLLVIYLQMSGTRNHVYIYHSLDYGETFTVYHPVSIGPDPVYANFIAEDTLIKPGTDVQFTDLSNDADTWEWDFENDGIVDSYEQNPVHSYADTGVYSVKLTITTNGLIVVDNAVRYNYIHVTPTAGTDEIEIKPQISVFPNPAVNTLCIDIDGVNSNNTVVIYDLLGKPVIQCVPVSLKNFLIDVSELPAGIYFVYVNKSPGLYFQKICINH